MRFEWPISEPAISTKKSGQMIKKWRKLPAPAIQIADFNPAGGSAETGEAADERNENLNWPLARENFGKKEPATGAGRAAERAAEAEEPETSDAEDRK